MCLLYIVCVIVEYYNVCLLQGYVCLLLEVLIHSCHILQFILSFSAHSNPPFTDGVTHSTPQMVSLV